MYTNFTEDELRIHFRKLNSNAEYMVVYDLVSEQCLRNHDIHPIEIWVEAHEVINDIKNAKCRSWAIKCIPAALKSKYSVIRTRQGTDVERTPQQQQITAMLVVSVVILLLSLAKRVAPGQEQTHPYYDEIRNLRALFADSSEFNSLLSKIAVVQSDIESLTHELIREIDYFCPSPEIAPNPVQSQTDWPNELRIAKLRQIYLTLSSQLAANFTGKSQWFYVYRVMADNKIYNEKSYRLFLIDLIHADVPENMLPNTTTFSRKQDQIKPYTTFPNWKVCNGGKQSVLEEGTMIANLSFPILFPPK